MLHTVNKSPFSNRTLSNCLAHLTDGAAVLLIEDGVCGAAAGTAAAAEIARYIGRFPVYVLGPDLEARGIRGAGLMAGVKTVDYEGFVRLVTEHEVVQSWL